MAEKSRQLRESILLAAFFAAVITFIIVNFLFKYHDLGTSQERHPFCCPDLVRLLWRSSNMSLNPCADIYRYTCYKWDSNQLSSVLEDIKLEEVIIPTFTRSKTAAGHTISRYYSECLEEASKRDQEVDSATEALVRALRPPAKLSPVDMLTFLLRITLLYGMSPGISISMDRKDWATIQLKFENSLNWAEEMRLQHRRRGLKVFNAVTGSRLHLGDLVDLAARAFNEDSSRENLTVSSAGILQEILPGIRRDDWLTEWSACSGHRLALWIHTSNVSRLKTYFNTLILNSQPTSLALLIIEASVDAWLDFLNATKYLTANVVCNQKAHDAGLLWDVVVAETFGDPLKEDLVRNMHHIIVNASLSKILRILPAEDVLIALAAVRGKIYLTTDFHFHNITPPFDVFGFWKRRLAVGDYERDMRRFHKRLSLPRYEFGAFTEVTMDFTLPPRRIIAPPIFYRLLNFTSGVDPLVNMAVAGVKMVTEVRRLLLSNRYSKRTMRALYDLSVCRRKNISQTDPNLKFDVEFAVNITKDSTWNSPVNAKSLDLTRAKVFYMSYIFHNWCGGGMFKRTVSRMVNKVMSAISDFRQAFGCPPDPITTYCYAKKGRV